MIFIKGNKKSDLSDEALIEGFKKENDNSYVAELYNRYIHLVYGVCIKYLKDKDRSKDIVMQVFEKILLDLNKYNINNFKYWLHTVTKNACLRELQKNKNVNSIEGIELVGEDGSEDDAERSIVLEKYLKTLPKIISELKEEQRICVELFYLKNYSYQQICEQTPFNEKQVKSYIQNAKRNLRIALENTNEKY